MRIGIRGLGIRGIGGMLRSFRMILVSRRVPRVGLAVHWGLEKCKRWDLCKLLWKIGSDWVVYISAVESLRYVKVSDSCRGCNDHLGAICIR